MILLLLKFVDQLLLPPSPITGESLSLPFLISDLIALIDSSISAIMTACKCFVRSAWKEWNVCCAPRGTQVPGTQTRFLTLDFLTQPVDPLFIPLTLVARGHCKIGLLLTQWIQLYL